MSHERGWSGFALARVARGCAAVIGLGIALAAQETTTLPAGSELVKTRCLVCHEDDLIRQQRLTRAGWQRELEKMIRWGAVVPTDQERTLLVDYLAATHGTRPVASTPASDGEQGTAILRRRCLVCHDIDLVEQQRLDSGGWTREVDKMVRWGATVSDTERAVLVEYLASRYGRR